MKNDEALRIDGKTIEKWDSEWAELDGGLMLRKSKLTPDVGLYRMLLNGRIVALGSGTDKKQGIEKRLYDFGRPGNSSRNHHAGRLIYEHRYELVVEVLITGQGKAAREKAEELKWPMIRRHEPIWTAPPRDPRTFIRPRKRKPKSFKTKPAPYTGTVPKG